MSCSLCKFTKEVKTHYVGKTGNEYLYSKYANHGKGGIYRGFQDLPHDEYPYTIKYKIEPSFKVCTSH